MSFPSQHLAVVASILIAGAASSVAAATELTVGTGTKSRGENHTKPVVTSNDAKSIELRTAYGKSANANLAESQRQLSAKPVSGGQSYPIISSLLSQIPQIWQAALDSPIRRDDAPPARQPMFLRFAVEPEVVPADLVHVHISADYLRQCVERAIERHNAVSDVILGTQINGWATTVGRTGAQLEAGDERALLSVTFAGTIRSRTVGTNGPAVLHSYSETLFEARSRLVLASAGVYAVPANTTARTSTTTYDIESTLPGLRGRIVERAAWRKSSELRSRADQIAAQRAANRISTALNQEMKQAADGIERTLIENICKLAAAHNGKPSMHFSSTHDYLHLVMRRPGATDDHWEPPAIEGSPYVSVRIHRLVVRQAMTDTQMTAALRTVLAGLIMAQSDQQGLTARTGKALDFDIQWSDDRNWMIIDYWLNRRAPAKLAKK